MTLLLIGSGAREHALARAIMRSSEDVELISIGTNMNPGIRECSRAYHIADITDVDAVAKIAATSAIDLAVIGPEAPLAAGVVDRLTHDGIACIGPTKKLAQIETSKSFARGLLRRNDSPGLPRYKTFSREAGAADFLHELGDAYVVKADGLMGGKGVKVAGDHLQSHEEALAFIREIVAKGMGYVIEEKFIGEEFSLMSFTDGEHLSHMPPVQDHKRAFVGDTGPNTGGMGSYSDADHSLPFLSAQDITAAQQMNERAVHALRKEFGEPYRGILYGGFMATADGVKLIEYNARFGDPEAMNVLLILESDIVHLFQAIVAGTLTPDAARFAPLATVVKYAVPEGYPDAPIKNQPIDVSRVDDANHVFLASVDEKDGRLIETGSRTVAAVGIGKTISAAEKFAEAEICRVTGPLVHREDIGTDALVQKRVDHMKNLRKI